MAEFIDAYGIAIIYDVHPADGPVRGVVQLAHGLGEHAGRYGSLIAALTGAGYTVYADDHRGHGRTGMKQHGGKVDKLGTLGPGGLRATQAAMWQFTELIRAENPGLPLILIGHSWGSFLSQWLLNRHAEAFDAVVLSGSALLTPTTLNALPLNRAFDGPHATGLEWLATDEAIWSEFRADPLTTEKPLLKLFGFADAMRIYELPAKRLPRDVPVLLMVGSDDPVGGPVSVHKLAKAYRERSGLTDITTLVYPDDRHEIFNEKDQENVRGDLLAWLDRRISPAP